MAYVTRGSLEPPLANRSGNHLWKRVTPADWARWDGTTWDSIAAALTRIPDENMSLAAPATVRTAGEVLSHSLQTTATFTVGTGWTGVAGQVCNYTDDFIWDGTVWIRTTSTPLSDTAGVLV